MDAAVALYNSEMSLQAIGDELGLNPIKVRLAAHGRVCMAAEKVKNFLKNTEETQDYRNLHTLNCKHPETFQSFRYLISSV